MSDVSRQRWEQSYNVRRVQEISCLCLQGAATGWLVPSVQQKSLSRCWRPWRPPISNVSCLLQTPWLSPRSQKGTEPASRAPNVPRANYRGFAFPLPHAQAVNSKAKSYRGAAETLVPQATDPVGTLTALKQKMTSPAFHNSSFAAFKPPSFCPPPASGGSIAVSVRVPTRPAPLRWIQVLNSESSCD